MNMSEFLREFDDTTRPYLVESLIDKGLEVPDEFIREAIAKIGEKIPDNAEYLAKKATELKYPHYNPYDDIVRKAYLNSAEKLSNAKDDYKRVDAARYYVKAGEYKKAVDIYTNTRLWSDDYKNFSTAVRNLSKEDIEDIRPKIDKKINEIKKKILDGDADVAIFEYFVDICQTVGKEEKVIEVLDAYEKKGKIPPLHMIELIEKRGFKEYAEKFFYKYADMDYDKVFGDSIDHAVKYGIYYFEKAGKKGLKKALEMYDKLSEKAKKKGYDLTYDIGRVLARLGRFEEIIEREAQREISSKRKILSFRKKNAQPQKKDEEFYLNVLERYGRINQDLVYFSDFLYWIVDEKLEIPEERKIGIKKRVIKDLEYVGAEDGYPDAFEKAAQLSRKIGDEHRAHVYEYAAKLFSEK